MLRLAFKSSIMCALDISPRVPFILVEEGKWPQSDYIVFNMEGSRHTLPLTTVYRDLQPINASPYTFLQVLFGLEYHVGLLYEEKMLHLGKNITDVGICNLKNGIPEIKSCKDLPYFLSPQVTHELKGEMNEMKSSLANVMGVLKVLPAFFGANSVMRFC